MSEERFTQTFDIDRAVDAYEIHSAITRSLSTRIYIFIVMAVIFFAMGWSISGVKDGSTLNGVLISSLVSVLLAYLIAWPPKRWGRLGLRPQIKSYRENMSLEDSDTTYTFGENELLIDDNVHGGRLAWQKVHAWHDGTDLFLIYRAPQFFYFLDKKLMDEGQQAILRERLVSSKAKQL